ncbi:MULTISPECIES: peptidoglycan bridge formation glycyltransferase FemA/FemB family protein [unclassified Gemella]|uniref:peptidoglycan bridge formation glycyltransferase FemA/FemB family protein n=1 Tax=unclassified Gemella TaxID=2624949 RepID=UPI0015D0C6E4|nr:MULTISPECIES: peptidoglycan bridge formation glycyltransferase FemA/FemB family protein [unclassified Gemella]MBF0709638.1 aminoacyltransferase [Gemella sp. GL1.1]NYS26982.1 aminoacyltransferase [Gemella sp. GL1]
MALKLLTEKEYEAALENFSKYYFMQTAEMAKLLIKRGNGIYYLGLEINGEIKALALAFYKKVFGGIRIEVNSGPLYTDYEYSKIFYKELINFAKKNSCIELVVKPDDNYSVHDSSGNLLSEENIKLLEDLKIIGYEHDGLKTGYGDGEIFWHYMKDLEGLTQDTLTSSFINKAKSLSKKVATFGIKLRTLSKNELHLFKEITESTSTRREYDDKPLEYYEMFYDAFGEKCEYVLASINFQEYLDNLNIEKIKLEDKIADIDAKLAQVPNSTKQNNLKKQYNEQLSFMNERVKEAQKFIEKYGKDDVSLSGALFVYGKDTTYYLFSGSRTEFNKFYAPVVVQEYSMRKAIDLGHTCYNFLGVLGIFDGSDGVLRYKQNYNGYIVRKAGVFRYYPNRFKYNAINFIKKVLRR